MVPLLFLFSGNEIDEYWKWWGDVNCMYEMKASHAWWLRIYVYAPVRVLEFASSWGMICVWMHDDDDDDHGHDFICSMAQLFSIKIIQSSTSYYSFHDEIVYF